MAAVLIVDDDAALRDALAEAVRDLGHDARAHFVRRYDDVKQFLDFANDEGRNVKAVSITGVGSSALGTPWLRSFRAMGSQMSCNRSWAAGMVSVSPLGSRK